jgi:DNA invertase Pin-like site-specific DNA recombinase
LSGSEYDWSNPDDVMMGRFKSAIAGRERDYITQRSINGKKEKAREGGFLGGLPALGYKVCYELDEKGKRFSWLAIDESERELVVLIFDLYIKYGGSGCAKRLNEMGYKGKTGSDFIPRTICEPPTHRLSIKVNMNRQRIADMKV